MTRRRTLLSRRITRLPRLTNARIHRTILALTSARILTKHITLARLRIGKARRRLSAFTTTRVLVLAFAEPTIPRTIASARPGVNLGLTSRSLTINLFTGIHPRYHLPSDEARYLDPAQMEAVTRTAFAAVWAFADVSERPRIENPLPPSVPRYQ